MRRSEWEDRCKRHPEHRLSRGVCPGCLRDRLAHLSASSSSATTTVDTRASSTSATASSHSSGAGASAPAPHRAALPADDVSSVHVVFGGASSAGDSFANNVAAFSQPIIMPTAVNNKPMMATMMREDAAGSEIKGKVEEVKSKKKSGKKKKKIGKFLSRLVGAEKRRQAGNGDGDGGELFHSKTMKEKTASKWVFF